MSEPEYAIGVQKMLAWDPDKWRDHMLTRLRELFIEKKQLEPMVELLTHTDPETGAVGAPVYSIVVMPIGNGNWGEIREHFAATIRGLVKQLDPMGLMFCAEAWIVKGDDVGESAEDFYEKWGGVANHPKRVEILSVNVEWKEGTPENHTAEIDRSAGEDDPQVRDWDHIIEGGFPVAGLFSNFLVPDRKDMN